jgi:hypothetical protein
MRVGLSRVVNRVHRKETRALVEKSGIPVVAIISTDDLERFAQFEREREERFAVIDRMRAPSEVPPEEIEREAERSLAEARAPAAAGSRARRLLGVSVAVLDTNVLVSGFPARGTVPATFIDRWQLPHPRHRRRQRRRIPRHQRPEAARAWPFSRRLVALSPRRSGAAGG